MKILIIHQYYLMPGQFGGSRFNEMAQAWAELGHQVSVIAGTVDHGTGQIPGKYQGRWVTTEKDGLVTVHRCYVPATYSKGYLGRMWGFLGFTFSASFAVLRAGPADVVIATSPPLIAVIPGWIAAHRSLKSTPWIFEIRDLWPESAVTTGVIGKNSPIAKMLYVIERWACRSASRINVLTPAFQADIERRGLAHAGKIVFVPNGADTSLFMPGSRDNDFRRELNWGDRFVALYAGAHGRANAIGQLIEAAEHLRARKDILIACVGDGPERIRLQAEAAERKLDNIIFYGPRPKSQMPEIVNACDIGLAVLQNNATFRTVYPNKVFDYMACSRPVLLAIDGVARDLVCGQAGAGIFAEPENGREIAEAIQQLADAPRERAEMGVNGRQWVANASRQALAARYLSIMEDLTGLSSKAVPVPRAATLPGN